MNQPTFRKIALGLLWLTFTIYAFNFAPPDQPDTLDLIKRLSTGQIDGINPLIVALFNIMGVLPVMYACLLYTDGRGQRLPAWAFSVASFAVGAFALLPYLALRQPNPSFVGKKTWLIKLLDSRLLGIGVAIAAMGLFTYGLTQGNWQEFVFQWKTSRFIHVMSLDFCLLCLLFPTLLGDDMARRGLKDARIFWTVAFIPLFGAVIYLVLRPQLAEIATPQTTAVPT
ncbi:DUF2834 domain-containing protein [Phormidium sp. CLA17]|uniref:DUF2834 domain-containing protein n=1 Tax=Leptolyngbya sp. Cla-17 TaxID=2803751 RepID=UPI001490FF53|nr:DUF2834 domain-containing protein [Leptolyngbya sp. Cla-17]MBM0741770.1 DUF2834 domain-containing protein [Leptolyngbya sp. Cla-17]